MAEYPPPSPYIFLLPPSPPPSSLLPRPPPPDRADPQVTLAAWQEFDSQQEAVREFVSKAHAASDRDLNFSSPESLAAELSQARVSRTSSIKCQNKLNAKSYLENVYFINRVHIGFLLAVFFAVNVMNVMTNRCLVCVCVCVCVSPRCS